MTKRRRRIAILGCSFSAHDYNPSHKNWSYFLAKDNPDIDVVSFARCGHGYDFARFVLNWMVYTKYEVDMIIMNIPPFNRKFNWIAPVHITIESVNDLFKIEQVEDNLYAALSRNPKIIYGAVAGADSGYNDLTDLSSTQVTYKKPFEDHALNNELVMMDHYVDSMKLLSYEGLMNINCRIFYYQFLTQKSINQNRTITNLEIKTDAVTYMSNKFPSKEHLLYVSEHDRHFSTYGNELFYLYAIKADKNISEAISNLTR